MPVFCKLHPSICIDQNPCQYCVHVSMMGGVMAGFNPEAPMQMEPRNGSPTFYKLLEECRELHDRKSHDYANNDDPYGNYRFAGILSSLFGFSPDDAGFAGRIGEKIYRLANLERDGKVPLNESIAETEGDLVTIMALWMAQRRDKRISKSELPRQK